jgi:hypothetical protein
MVLGVHTGLAEENRSIILICIHTDNQRVVTARSAHEPLSEVICPRCQLVGGQTMGGVPVGGQRTGADWKLRNSGRSIVIAVVYGPL